MSMAQATRLITADELFHLPDDGYHRYELVAGKLVVMMPAGSLHGAISSRLTAALCTHVDEWRLGAVMTADTGFKLESDPDTVRAPDVAFVSRGRIPADGLPKAFWRGAPDLAVEVLSPSDSLAEAHEKIAEYLRLGTKQVWFVEPSLREVTVHRPGQAPDTLGETDTLDGGDLLPGFRYPLSRLFSFDL
jgi:Uma2 family endonuclease